MVTINNSDLTKELVEGGKIAIAKEQVPTQLADKVVPVMEVNPKLFRRINISASITADGTVYTTPSNKEFYLTNISLSASNKTASQDSLCTMTVTPKGYPATVVCYTNFSTSALNDVGDGNMNVNFNVPMLLEKSTNLVLASTNCSYRRCFIAGYEVFNTNV
jgi:hypothetical protein